MPRIQPLLPLLRPLAAPRRTASQQLFQFSTATRLRADKPPKSTSPPSSRSWTKAPNPSPEAPPTPQAASRAADLAAAEAVTDADSAQAPAPKPTLPSRRPKSSSPKTSKPADDVDVSTFPAEASDATTDLRPVKPQTLKADSKPKTPLRPRFSKQLTFELPPPKYHVARSASRNLPIYTDYKRGGNLHLTTIRKITGDLSALRDELRVFLSKKNEDVKINSLTQHVIVKGHHVSEITDFLRARGM